MTNDSHRIRHSIDEYFADMNEHPSLQSKILAQTRGEVKVKKKFSIGLALGIVFVILAGTAMALVFSDVFFKEAAVLQEEKGNLSQWSLDDKIALIGTMEESGIPIPWEQLQALQTGDVSEDTANRIADEILVEAKMAREALIQAYGFFKRNVYVF